tara:strand:- start:417 stop:596 length:180 start_codon:yes stop_codon:yes gene_type:complete
MNNPWSIIDDKDVHECSWCLYEFNAEDEGELIVHEKHCDILCGQCLEKYIKEIIKIYNQ